MSRRQLKAMMTDAETDAFVARCVKFEERAPPLHLDCLATMPAEERRCFHALIAARDARRAWLHAKFKTLLRVRPQLKGWRAGPPGYDFYMPDEKYPTPPDCTRFLVDKLREWADRAEDGRPRGRRRRVFKPPPPRMPNDRFTALRNEISEIERVPLAEVAMQAGRVAGNRALAARLDLSLCGRASRTGAFAALGLATGRNGGRRPNRFVLRSNNRVGGWLLDDVDHRGFDWHLHYLSSFRCLRRALFLGRWFRRAHARAPDLGLRFFWRRVLCRHLARRPGACLAAFRALLARRDALFCFGHGYLP